MKKMVMSEVGNAVGKFVILWREDAKRVAVILKLDKNEKKVTYELMSGTDENRVFESRYIESQAVNFYDSLKEAVKSLKKDKAEKPAKTGPKLFKRGQAVWTAVQILQAVVCGCCNQVKYRKAMPAAHRYRVKEEYPVSVLVTCVAATREKQPLWFLKKDVFKTERQARAKAGQIAATTTYDNCAAYMARVGSQKTGT